MKVDFLQITRLSPTSFTISPPKTQITPRYAKPQKNKNMKIKLFTLQHKIKYSFLIQHIHLTDLSISINFD